MWGIVGECGVKWGGSDLGKLEIIYVGREETTKRTVGCVNYVKNL
jgi:hypothetical protein